MRPTKYIIRPVLGSTFFTKPLATQRVGMASLTARDRAVGVPTHLFFRSTYGHEVYPSYTHSVMGVTGACYVYSTQRYTMAHLRSTWTVNRAATAAVEEILRIVTSRA